MVRKVIGIPDWLGYFYDASGGWIYHVELGWLYAEEGEDGNYWLYDSKLGWLWTGSAYFDSTKSDKSYLYSVSESGCFLRILWW